MKRVLSLVLALVLVLGTILPVFAEEVMTAGEELKALGVIDGSDTGLDEEKALTRAQAAVVISEMYGKKDEAKAYAFPASFTDVEEGMWYTPYIAYAEAQGWMSGDGEGLTFRPNDTMKAQELNAMYLVVLGYTVDWAEVNAKATELEFAVDAADATLVLRGEAFEAILAALDVMPMDEEMTLGTKLALEGYVAPVAPVVDLEVVSVTALNHKQIEVLFNNELDEDTVLPANFAVVAATTVALGEDNMTVTVTLDDADALTTQPLAITLTVADVKDLNASEVVEADYELSILDTAKPVAVSVELTGPQTFDITFSEPILTPPTVKVNSGVYGVTVQALDGSNVVEVKLSASQLNDGDYDVEVAGFADYAAIDGDTATLVLTYAEDVSVPTATIKSATQTSVVVAFDRVVTLDDGTEKDYFYHTFSTYQPAAFATHEAKEFTLDFTDHPIPAGPFTLVINQDGSADVDIVDEWGNKVTEDIILTGEVTADVTAPTITKIEVVSESVVEITYSEDMENAASEMLKESNFAVVDSAGDDVTAFTATYDAADPFVTTLTFAPQLDGGIFTVEVSGLTDKALAPNTLATITNTFEVTDLTSIDPTVALDVVVDYVAGAGTDAEVIYVTYPEAMATTGQYSVLDASNYLLALDGTTYAALDSDATLEIFGTAGTVVKITVPDIALVSTTTTMQIARVADAAGNTTAELAFVEVLTALVPASVTVTSVEQTAANKVTITVNKPLTVVLASGFTSETVAIAAIDSWSVNSDNETVIYATVDAIDASTATDTSDILTDFDVVVDINVSETGIKMAAQDTGAVLDAWAPEFASVAQKDDDEFTITLSEDIKAGLTEELMATDLVLKLEDGTALVAGNDYSLTYATKVITVLLATPLTADETLSIESIATPVYIIDAADNALVGFTGEELAMDLTGPTLVTRTSTTLTSVVVTLNEKLNAADAADVKAAFSITDTDTSGAVVITTAIYDDTAMTITFTIGAGVTDTDLLVTDGSLTDVFGNVYAAGTVATADATDLAQ